MIEQKIVTTPEGGKAIAVLAEPRAKQVRKHTRRAVVKRAATKNVKTGRGTRQTAEEKRRAKNAAVREWRAKNKQHFAAYMKQWREKKRKQRESAAKAAKNGPKA